MLTLKRVLDFDIQRASMRIEARRNGRRFNPIRNVNLAQKLVDQCNCLDHALASSVIFLSEQVSPAFGANLSDHVSADAFDHFNVIAPSGITLKFNSAPLDGVFLRHASFQNRNDDLLDDVFRVSPTRKMTGYQTARKCLPQVARQSRGSWCATCDSMQAREGNTVNFYGNRAIAQNSGVYCDPCHNHVLTPKNKALELFQTSAFHVPQGCKGHPSVETGGIHGSSAYLFEASDARFDWIQIWAKFVPRNASGSLDRQNELAGKPFLGPLQPIPDL